MKEQKGKQKVILLSDHEKEKEEEERKKKVELLIKYAQSLDW